MSTITQSPKTVSNDFSTFVSPAPTQTQLHDNTTNMQGESEVAKATKSKMVLHPMKGTTPMNNIDAAMSEVFAPLFAEMEAIEEARDFPFGRKPPYKCPSCGGKEIYRDTAKITSTSFPEGTTYRNTVTTWRCAYCPAQDESETPYEELPQVRR